MPNCCPRDGKILNKRREKNEKNNRNDLSSAGSNGLHTDASANRFRPLPDTLRYL
jgi:hypothetical protein